MCHFLFSSFVILSLFSFIVFADVSHLVTYFGCIFCNFSFSFPLTLILSAPIFFTSLPQPIRCSSLSTIVSLFFILFNFPPQPTCFLLYLLLLSVISLFSFIVSYFFPFFFYCIWRFNHPRHCNKPLHASSPHRSAASWTPQRWVTLPWNPSTTTSAEPRGERLPSPRLTDWLTGREWLGCTWTIERLALLMDWNLCPRSAACFLAWLDMSGVSLTSLTDWLIGCECLYFITYPWNAYFTDNEYMWSVFLTDW